MNKAIKILVLVAMWAVTVIAILNSWCASVVMAFLSTWVSWEIINSWQDKRNWVATECRAFFLKNRQLKRQVDELKAKVEKLPDAETCRWALTKDDTVGPGFDCWKSQCDPEKKEMRFCIYCGKPVEQIIEETECE